MNYSTTDNQNDNCRNSSLEIYPPYRFENIHKTTHTNKYNNSLNVACVPIAQNDTLNNGNSPKNNIKKEIHSPFVKQKPIKQEKKQMISNISIILCICIILILLFDN